MACAHLRRPSPRAYRGVLVRRCLFIDETGGFNEDSPHERAVGGLLLVGDDDHRPDAGAIHDRAARAIEWPVRLHGSELRSHAFAALWLSSMAEPHERLGIWARRVTIAAPLVNGRAWTSAAATWAKANRKGLSPPRELHNWIYEQRRQV